MVDKFEFDLHTLKSILDDSFSFVPGSLHGCIPEVTIGSEVLVALRAGNFGGIGGVVRPS